MAPKGNMPNFEYPHYGYSHYHTCIFSIAPLRHYFLSNLLSIRSDFNIREDEEEYLFDYVIMHCFNDAVAAVHMGQVTGLYTHDIYKSVYRALSLTFVRYLKSQIHNNDYRLQIGQKVKLVVAGDSLIVVKGFIPNV